MIAFGPWNGSDVLDVVLAMRPADRREVFATRPDDCPWRLFSDLWLARPGMVWAEVVYDGTILGEPLATFGVAQRSPGVGSAFMLATARLRPMQARALARRVRTVVAPHLVKAGLHRADCESWAGHASAHAFLRWAGAERGQPRRGVGRRGEDFVEFAWLAPRFSEQEAA